MFYVAIREYSFTDLTYRKFIGYYSSTSCSLRVFLKCTVLKCMKEERNAYKILVGKLQRTKPLKRPRRRRGDSNEMNIKEM